MSICVTCITEVKTGSAQVVVALVFAARSLLLGFVQASEASPQSAQLSK